MPRCLGASVPRSLGASEPRCLGASVPRCLGASVPRCLGASVPRCLGASVPRCLGAGAAAARTAARRHPASQGSGQCVSRKCMAGISFERSSSSLSAAVGAARTSDSRSPFTSACTASIPTKSNARASAAFVPPRCKRLRRNRLGRHARAAPARGAKPRAPGPSIDELGGQRIDTALVRAERRRHLAPIFRIGLLEIRQHRVFDAVVSHLLQIAGQIGDQVRTLARAQ
ncbi:methyltransferase, FkbM family domain protein [Burkholderia pseudomallei MSHR5596]|nr:methyltransferase, FkbM family domain protein [Burkholderia pseudomallei MSHR5596]